MTQLHSHGASPKRQWAHLLAHLVISKSHAGNETQPNTKPQIHKAMQLVNLRVFRA